MTELKEVAVVKSTDCQDEGRTGRDWSVFRQHLAALIANLAAFSGGMCLGWSSPAVPLLQREQGDVDLPLYVTIEEGSWISCLLPLGAAVGSLPVGYLSDCIGRKKAILSLAIPYIVGWMLILFSDTSLTLMYVGRFIAGLGVGGTTVLVAQYNEEISEDSIRGALGVYLDFNLCSGSFFLNLLGCFLSYMGFSIVSCIIPIIFVCTFIWMPESPVYLVLEDRMDDAMKSLTWLRKGKRLEDIQTEIKRIKEHLNKEKEESGSRPLMCRMKEFFSDLSSQSTLLKTVGIVLGLMFLQQVSGINAILFYTVSIFQSSGSNISSNMSSAIVAGCMAASDFCSSFYVDRLGRRPMLLFSTLATAVCLAVLSAYFHYNDNNYDVSSWNWVPITALIIYVITYTAGFSQLPWLMMAELVPSKHQKWMSPLASFLNWGIAFILAKEFPDMRIHLGNDVSYGIFSSASIASFMFVWFLVPETNGRSREEIQDALRGKRR
ncbi:facilitated trehalose transporter Tret1 [Anabrus simplex]|uniref:facilitated trehalose transporter Tret1 n=1 Tax=Anabrus simplex TaxID=316456 RepID=UPI0035A27D8E